jgi:hypothetical protein
MLTLPLAAVPSQNFAAALEGQAVSFSLYLLGAGAAAALFLDLIVNGSPVFTARQARAYGALPSTTAPFMLAGRHYLGFQGDLLFLDTQANANVPAEDPVFTGLGTRWLLLYFSEADLQAAGLVGG